MISGRDDPDEAQAVRQPVAGSSKARSVETGARRRPCRTPGTGRRAGSRTRDPAVVPEVGVLQSPDACVVLPGEQDDEPLDERRGSRRRGPRRHDEDVGDGEDACGTQSSAGSGARRSGRRRRGRPSDDSTPGTSDPSSLRAMPIHLRAEPGDYAPERAVPRRPPPGAVHRRDVLRPRRPAGQRGARHARLHRHVRGRADQRADHRHGLPDGGHRVRGAGDARRDAADPGRHVRRVRRRRVARRHGDRHLGDVRRRHAAALRRHGRRGRRRRRSRSSRPPCGRPRGRRDGARRADRHERHLLRPRPDERAAVGSASATSASRWRRRCSTRSPPCTRIEALAIMTVSDILGATRTSASGSATSSCAGVDAMMRVACRVAVSDLHPSVGRSSRVAMRPEIPRCSTRMRAEQLGSATQMRPRSLTASRSSTSSAAEASILPRL